MGGGAALSLRRRISFAATVPPVPLAEGRAARALADRATVAAALVCQPRLPRIVRAARVAGARRAGGYLPSLKTRSDGDWLEMAKMLTLSG